MRQFVSLTIALMALLSASITHAGKKDAIPGFAWAKGMLYEAEQKSNYAPGDGARNTLCIFQGLKGQRPVAEAAPGDVNYHNGRWQIVILEFTPEGKKIFDINGDGYSEFEMTSWDMVQHYLNEHGFLKVVSQGSTLDAPLMRPTGLEPPEKTAQNISPDKSQMNQNELKGSMKNQSDSKVSK